MKAALVLTTINDPVCLEGYYENFKKHGWLDRVQVIVIPDLKSRETYRRCNELSRKGLRVICPTPRRQIEFLDHIGFPAELIPWNSDNRRNVGYLYALYYNAEIVISIDDDNFYHSGDYVGKHLSNMGEGVAPTSRSEWFNNCSLLNIDAYPRGYPYAKRNDHESISITHEEREVHVSAGLWLDDPDVDALTWLTKPQRATKLRGEAVIDGWCPVNTQNTAIVRDAMPAWYFWDIGAHWGYGDIFSGYVLQKCMKQVGGSVKFGLPVVEHRRNSHDHFKDLERIASHVGKLENWLEWFTDLEINGSTYADCARDVAYCLENMADPLFKKNGHNLNTWIDVTEGML